MLHIADPVVVDAQDVPDKTRVGVGAEPGYRLGLAVKRQLLLDLHDPVLHNLVVLAQDAADRGEVLAQAVRHLGQLPFDVVRDVVVDLTTFEQRFRCRAGVDLVDVLVLEHRRTL